MQLYDNIEIDDATKVTFTADGFMKAMPRVARTGIQIYGGDECGRPEMAQVRVYRPEKAVFDSAALKTLTHLPTTLEHPSQPVTAQNWKDHGTGETGDEVLRDGGTIRVPMMLRDAKAIAAWKDGSKKQLSVGYTCDLRWESGTTPDGETYDAVQDNIRTNHLAQCAAARGGPILTIGDNKEHTMNLKSVMVDGIQCEMTDTAAALVQKALATAQAQIDAFKKKSDEDEKECEDALKALATANDTIKAKDAEIVTLKQQVVDAKLKPEQIDALVKDRQIVFDKARVILGDGYKFDGRTVEEVRKAVVDKRLGDAAKGWDDAQIKVSFDTLTADMKSATSPRIGSIDHASSVFAGRPGPGYGYGGGGPVDPQAIRDAAYADSVREMNDAWKPQAVRDAEDAARRAANGR